MTRNVLSKLCLVSTTLWRFTNKAPAAHLPRGPKLTGMLREHQHTSTAFS